MGRWEPDARGRLERAALELYLENGYDQTTVAEIAGRAGLTERTFFRHFTDKREVLFRGGELAQAMADAIDAAPAAATPMDAVAAALDSTSDFFRERRPHARTRQTVIDAHPALQERELIKLASLATTITDALRRRGVSDTTAGLLGQTGIAVFKVAFERWLDDPADRPLSDLIGESLAELRAATHP